MSTVVAAYESLGLPGTYTVSQDTSGINVIPKRTLNDRGAKIEVSPVLAQRVTLLEGERTFAEAVHAVLASLSKSSGRNVGVGSQPNLGRLKKAVEANNEPAIGVLERLSEDFNDRSSFQLLYDPSEKIYCLSVVAVESLQKNEKSAAQPGAHPENPFFVKDKP